MNRKMIYVALLIMVLPIVAAAQAVSVMSQKPVEASRWIATNFAKGKNPPFSFKYGGKPSGSFITGWIYSVKALPVADNSTVKFLYIYCDPKTGLRVECEVTGFNDFNSVEWVLRFNNSGVQNTPQISDVKVSDLELQYADKGDFRLHYADGSHVSKADFHPRLKVLGVGESHRMAPEGGRSSQMSFPFFNIESASGQGVMVAVGWTGSWLVEVARSGERSVSIGSGMLNLQTYLYPKETIRTPSICLLFWNGSDRIVGHNKFRRFVLAHHTRKIDGKPTVYPISSSFNYGDPAPCNEYSCLTADYAIAMVKRYKQFKLIPEVFWLDAGWYSHANDVANNKNWANTVGNWSVNKINFPDGLSPIADEVHKLGAKFMVWFEPERVMKGSEWAVAHPEWMMDACGRVKQPEWMLDGEHDSYLFDMTNPEARQWMCEQIGQLIEENKIDYYRQDFNIEPEGFWAANDEQGRKGICEIRYIEGLYYFWDYLLDRFPGLLIDNCASGGRRIDLESISRSAPLWRTDYNYGEPVGYQSHTYGLNLYLPLHGTGTNKTDKFSFRASLGTSIIYNWKITDGSMSIYDMQACQAEFREVRPYFYEDFYPLTGTDDTTGDDIWLAYQLNRPSDSSGYVVAFRREQCPQASCTVKLSGLNADKIYTLTNRDSGDSVDMTGSELAKGLEIKLDQPRSSVLMKYALK